MFDFLNGLAWQHEDAPEEIDMENQDEFDEWVAENMEYLFKKYYYDALENFREDAASEEREHRNDPYEPEYDPFDKD